MPNPSHESEWLTRKKRIDPKLKALGWEIVPYDEKADLSKYTRHAIEEYPTASGPADYALVVDGQLLGVVEAKKLSLGPQGVLQQAERYSKGVADSPFNFRGFRVPFLFSTNGEVIWFHDMRHKLELSRKITDFFTPAALAELIQTDIEAADEAQPLLTAEERIHRAFAKLTTDKTFTDEQQRWLDRIRDHLVANLSIDQEDFLLMPVFEQAGGWVLANRVFDGKLNELLTELNEAIAA